MGKEQIFQAQTTIPRPMGLVFACHVSLMDDLWSVNAVYMPQTKPTGMQRDQSSKRQTEDTISQHQPNHGTTTEGMSFSTKEKGKKTRKAQHHTAYSLALPFQRKGGLFQPEIT